jgi:DNA-binding response OmpR family regulator
VRILVVEDDPSIARSLTESLQESGFEVDHVATGRAAIDRARQSEPDLVLLDLGLPDVDGYDVCRDVRSHSSVPIIVLTARGEELDRVLGLELGADDYVVKPFGFRELVARIRAVTRRVGAGGDPAEPSSDDLLVVGPLRIDRRSHRATLDGDELPLTPKEFDLLAMLAADPGAAHTRTDIVERVWDANWFGPTKTIDAHVAGIRKKLGDPRWIQAVRGVGFRLEAPE